MDAIIFSRSTKKKNYSQLYLKEWEKKKKFFVLLGVLFICLEIVEEIPFRDDLLIYCVVKPVLMLLFFTFLFLLRKYSSRSGVIDPSSSRQVLLILTNDMYQLIGLTVIMVFSGIDTFRKDISADLFFYGTKFWLLVLFSMNSFFLLLPKLLFCIIILIYHAVSLGLISETNSLRVCLQIFFTLITAIIMLFMVDTNRCELISHFLNMKNQERAWRHVLEFLREGVTIIDKNGEYVYGNRCVNKILGFEPRLSELNYNVDLSKVKNIKFHSEFKSPSTKTKTNTPIPVMMDSHVYENQLLNINLERTNNLNDLLDFLRSKWVNTVDLLRKLSLDNGGCLFLDGEIEEQGVKTFVEARITILSYEDKNNLLVTLYDITAKNILSSAKEVDKYRDKMIATISRQLLDPLNGSINYIRGAVENFGTIEMLCDEFLGPALNSMNFLTNTINDLVDLFNLNANSLRMKFEEHSLVDTVREALSLVGIQAEKKGLEITRNFEISPKISCYTDHRRLLQILLNILSIAIKYTFKGSVTVYVKRTSYKDFMIQIEDTGIGWKEEEKKKLLDEKGKIKLMSFAPSEFHGENEVGLMISNELAKKLGPISTPDSCGIFCESEYEKGSFFKFLVEDKSYSQKIESGDHYKINIIEDFKLRSYDLDSDDSLVGLPSADYNITPKFLPEGSHKYVKARTSRSMRKLGSTWKSPSTRKLNSARKAGQCGCPEVMLVDDDVFSMSSLEQIMGICHFTTVSCFHGLEGIREVMRRKEKKCGKKCLFLKLIFVEMNMQFMSGEEFTATIKDLINKNEIPYVPMIGCLKNYDMADLKRAREAGVVDCIIKPVSKEKVLEALQKIDIK